MRSPSRRAGYAAVVVCAVAIAGCSSPRGASSEAASRGVASPSASATAVPSGRLGETVTGEVMAGTVLAAMQEAGSFHLTRIVDQGDLKTGTEQDVQLTGDSVTTSATTDMGGITVDLITDGKKTYARSEALFQTPKWVEITPESPTPAVVSLADQLKNTQGTVDELSATLAAIEQYSATGTEQRDGAVVTVYEGRLPAQAALAQVPDDQREMATEEMGEQTFPVTLSVDDQGRLLQLTQSFALAGVQAAGSSTFTDYGKDFGLSMPQEGDIAPM